MANEHSLNEPQTVDEARDAVERSRARISNTLDQLEDRIVEKKHELQDKADVFRPVKRQVRMRPLAALAVGFGVGVVLGSVGGGSKRHKSERDDRHKRTRQLDDDGRREMRDWRAKRRERLQARFGDEHDERDDLRTGHNSRFDSVKHQLVGAMTSALSAAITSGVKDYVRDRGHNRHYDRSPDQQSTHA